MIFLTFGSKMYLVHNVLMFGSQFRNVPLRIGYINLGETLKITSDLILISGGSRKSI